MNMEAMGSKPVQPKTWIRMVEIMTPTDPRVSARMWRKTPVYLFGEGGFEDEQMRMSQPNHMKRFNTSKQRDLKAHPACWHYAHDRARARARAHVHVHEHARDHAHDRAHVHHAHVHD